MSDIHGLERIGVDLHLRPLTVSFDEEFAPDGAL